MNDSKTSALEAVRELKKRDAWLYCASDETKRIIGTKWKQKPHDKKRLIAHVTDGGVVALIPASLGLVVIDVDTRDGETWYKAWKDKLGKDCKPLMRVPSKRKNGFHLYFRCPPVRNKRQLVTVGGSKISIGVDIRSSSGYIVLWNDTLVRLNTALSKDTRELRGWIPIELFNMLSKDANAKPEWQMVGSRNENLNRDVFQASVDGNDDNIRAAAMRALVLGLPGHEIESTIEHAHDDGVNQQAQAIELFTQTPHRAARLAALYHRLTPNVRNYRIAGGAADYSGLEFTEWQDKLGWVELTGAEIISGLRRCNNGGDPGDARKAQLDLASIKHYGHVNEWNCYGKADNTDKDMMIGLPKSQAIDVTTGEIVKQKPEWRILRKIPVTPVNKPPTLWLKCLNTWTGGRPELQDFLQQMAGYALFGGNPEHRFMFLYGDGANGKSTFVDILTHVFGPDYAGVMGSSVYADKVQEHSTALKALEHKRFLVSGEIKPSTTWNVTNIKDITGGNIIYARNLYKNPEPMKVTGLPIFQGNYLPTFFDPSSGWGRRVIIVPFDTLIPESERIYGLEKQLKQEAGQILSWVIDGLEDYLLSGALFIPECVLDMTEEYLTDYSEGGISIEIEVAEAIDEYLSTLEFEPGKERWIWARDIFENLGHDYGDSQRLTTVFKTIKKHMVLRKWKPMIRQRNNVRSRGYQNKNG